MRYLVTGGGGFIGSNLVHHLLALGEEVRVIDNFATGREQNLRGTEGKIDLIRASVTDPEACAAAVKGVDYVLHQAAIPSVPRSVEDPISSDFANVHGTVVLLDACRRAKVKRVVFAASSSAYGETPTLPKVETMMPSPLSPYAASKLACEAYLQVFTHSYGLETVALRYFNVFGPRQDPTSQYAAVIPRFVEAYIAGKPATIFGDGEQSRDFCFIENAIEANLKASTAKGASGKVFNIACGERTTLNQVIDILGEIFGKRITPNYEPVRPGDVKHSLADITQARSVLGYAGEISFKHGLSKTVDWFRAGGGKA
jgi:UDP-glucose 4-epimerase